MDIEQVLPHVLDCIDTARLGPRKVAMLELVYHRQAGQRCSVHLGPAELARYGRSRHQVGYDRRTLEELVRLGMLRKIPGRGRIANGYSLREPKLWDSKRIYWLGPRERIISFFWLLQQRDLILLLRDAPGQSLFWCATGRLKKEVLLRDASVEHRATTEFHRAASSAPPVRIDDDHRAARQTASTPVPPLHLESEFTPSLSPPQGVSECPEIQPPLETQPQGKDEGLKLLEAVRSAVQTPVTGINADRIRGVGRSRPALIDALVAHAYTLTWVKTGNGAADAIETEYSKLIHRSSERTAPERDPAWLRRRIEVLRAQLSGFDHDDELLGPHLDQIEELESRLSALTAEIAS